LPSPCKTQAERTRLAPVSLNSPPVSWSQQQRAKQAWRPQLIQRYTPEPEPDAEDELYAVILALVEQGCGTKDHDKLDSWATSAYERAIETGGCWLCRDRRRRGYRGYGVAQGPQVRSVDASLRPTQAHLGSAGRRIWQCSTTSPSPSLWPRCRRKVSKNSFCRVRIIQEEFRNEQIAAQNQMLPANFALLATRRDARCRG
jgi:hypothetical protein